jgi:MFS family permease
MNAPSSVYQTSPIKRARATKAEIEARREALFEIVAAQQPMTVRQVFYQATVRSVIEKTEPGYSKVQTDLVLMRRSGTLPYLWLADATRWMRKPTTFGGIEEALQDCASYYRKSLWRNIGAYVEIWLEKDALAGVLYVNVYLLTKEQWSQAAIGAVLSTSGLIGIMAHPAVGAFIDRTRAKRALIIVGAFVLSGCGLAIIWVPVLPVVLVADIIMAVLGGVFAPTVAAITLGLYGQEALPTRLGRNAAFDRAGNVFIAVFIGIVGVAYSQKAPFYLAPLFATLTTIAVLSIPAGSIDYDKARGLETDGSHQAGFPTDWRVLIRDRPLVVFAAAAALFHFANASMLPLVVQKLALANPGWETSLTSAAIIVAQFATILMALLVTRANDFGRKPLLLLAFAAVPLRGGLCMWSDDPTWLLVVQVLDGVSSGLFEALLPLVLADIMGGTGHYSLARGLVGTVQGIGGSSSQVVAGYIVTTAGYNAAFLTLAIVATTGLLLVIVAMPETTPSSRGSPC